MSSSNELEIISRGSIDMSTPEHSSLHNAIPTVRNFQQTTNKPVLLQHVKTDQSTTSLEPLPPEKPRYPNQYEAGLVGQNKKEEEEEISLEIEAATIPLSLERATQQLAESRLQTDSLLQRIEDLSGKIRSGLNLVETTGTTVSELPVTITASDIRGNLHDVMTTSSHAAGDGEEVRNSEGDETLSEHCASEPDEIEKDRERGMTSPEGPEVDPKLAKALEKMKKLDKRLADVVMREREVKEQRRQLELQMTGVVDLQEPQNTEDGVPSFSPVFQTQLPDDSISNKHATDFIQRNIEEAGVAVVLSESEKLRLEQLLAQDEEHTMEMDDGSAVSVNADANVFKLSAESQNALRRIDIQLQAIGGCEGESNVRDHSDQELSVAGWQDGQQLREIDEKLAQLKKSSPQQAISPSALQHLIPSSYDQ